MRLPAELTPEQEEALANSATLKSDKDDEASRITPQVLLLSSGEITPFTLQITAPGITASYRIEADALGRVQRSRAALRT